MALRRCSLDCRSVCTIGALNDDDDNDDDDDDDDDEDDDDDDDEDDEAAFFTDDFSPPSPPLPLFETDARPLPPPLPLPLFETDTRPRAASFAALVSRSSTTVCGGEMPNSSILANTLFDANT
jgi:hypothetical protein